MSNIKFLTMKDLCNKLSISRDFYYKITNPDHANFDPEFPKPVEAFTNKKLRFSSIDVDNYIKRYTHSVAA